MNEYRLRLWLKRHVLGVYLVAREVYRVFRLLQSLWQGQHKEVLFYVGAHRGYSLSMIHRLYKCCYVFEPIPENVAVLRKKFARSAHRVKIYHAAAHTYTGETAFHISSNNVSSSLGHDFNRTWLKKHPDVKMVRAIKVPCVHLLAFIEEHHIDYIDDYISDVQGMDLTILKTLEPLIRKRKIGSIQCEVELDEKPHIYQGIAAGNAMGGFEKLLSADYELVAQGRGMLKEGAFGKPSDWEVDWEADCMWKAKDDVPGGIRVK